MKNTKSFNTGPGNLQAFHSCCLFQASPLIWASRMPVVTPQCEIVTVYLAPGCLSTWVAETLPCTVVTWQSWWTACLACGFRVPACLDAYLKSPLVLPGPSPTQLFSSLLTTKIQSLEHNTVSLLLWDQRQNYYYDSLLKYRIQEQAEIFIS